MITVTLTANELDVQGHANYAPEGQDIVCAAVSALTLTLAFWVQDHEADGEALVILVKGASRVKFKPGKEIKQEWRTVRNAIFAGLKAMSEQYPDNLTVCRL